MFFIFSRKIRTFKQRGHAEQPVPGSLHFKWLRSGEFLQPQPFHQNQRHELRALHQIAPP